MQHAVTHASTMLDPHPLTLAPPEAAITNLARSSEDSNTSQQIPLNISTSDVSSTAALPTVPDEEEDTPPTSTTSSQLGSQETRSIELQEQKESTENLAVTDAVQEHRSNTNSQSPPPNSLSGAKRTASGEVKRSSVNGLADVVSQSKGFGHARTTSSVSNGNISEVGLARATTANPGTDTDQLSQQLRTRLKYAMIKVQNGWQTRSLDEVESLASQSPRSTVSGFPNSPRPRGLLSPRTVMSRSYGRESSESDSSDSTLETRALVTLNSPQVSSRRALAPPVDIVPSSRRRATPNGTYQNTHSARHTSQSSRPPTSHRTPSQNAAMEADAVETLLFMASPNNSGYNPSLSQDSTIRSTQTFAASQLTSPLRTQFSQTSMTSPKRVAFSNGRPVYDKAAIIDRMLNDLSDDSDEELERAFELAEKSKISSAATAAAPPAASTVLT
ncbi:uncharacterized protein PV06_03688 [Exophiala oligosperma]|uniref:Uncharacterized protein n=2 Tax=Chaetothyriales TaxID=34395 RepID=A0A0D2EBB8_9EURO|nr:uncharacterized protein PV06_03688 [Exophiala oligosperma]KIW45289.1 hypothetical protein PV06_03688 [Exophiala oligosperma]